MSDAKKTRWILHYDTSRQSRVLSTAVAHGGSPATVTLGAVRRLRSPGFRLIAIGFLVIGGLLTAGLRYGSTLTGQAILTNPGIFVDTDATSVSLDCYVNNKCVIGYLKKSGEQYHGSLAFCDSNICENPTRMHGSRPMPGDTQTEVICTTPYTCRLLLHSPTGRTFIYWCADQYCSTYTESEVPFGGSVPKADMDCVGFYCFVTGAVNSRIKMFKCHAGSCMAVSLPGIDDMTASEPSIACPWEDSCRISFKPSGNAVTNYGVCRGQNCAVMDLKAVGDGEFNGIGAAGYGIIQCQDHDNCTIMALRQSGISRKLQCHDSFCSGVMRHEFQANFGTRQVVDCKSDFCGFYTSNKQLYHCAEFEACLPVSSSPLSIPSGTDFGYSSDYIAYANGKNMLLYHVSEAGDPICGNGLREGNEQCDDGNLRSGDGCSDICRTDSASSAGSCTGVCPDGSTYPTCNVDGSLINYVSDPCEGSGSAGSRSSARVSPSVCGDGKCGEAETCSTCAQDCGTCANNCVEVPIANFGNTFNYPTDSPACSTFEACYSSCVYTPDGCTCTGFKCGNQLCGYAPERQNEQPVCGPLCVTSSAGSASSGCGQSMILCAPGVQQICVNGQWTCAMSSASSRRSSAVSSTSINASLGSSAASSQLPVSSGSPLASSVSSAASSRRSRVSSAATSLIPVCGQIGTVCAENTQCCSGICRSGNCAPPIIGASSDPASSSQPETESSSSSSVAGPEAVSSPAAALAASSKRMTIPSSRAIVLLLPSSADAEPPEEAPVATPAAPTIASSASANQCGNGIIQANEVCDLGIRNSNLPDGLCRLDCQLGRCNDGIRDSSEECDDGNRIDGDGCDARCRRETPQGTLPVQVVNLPLTLSFEGGTETQHAAGAEQQGQQAFVQGVWLPGQTTVPQPQEVLPGSAYFPAQLSGLPSQTASVVYGQSDAPNTTQSGPGALAMMAAGSAAGYAWIRRRRNQ
jgi:cysteine-rich repeat protein